MAALAQFGSLAARLKAFREAQCLTKQALARRAGTTTVSIWHWETGKRIPRDQHLERLALALNVPLESLRVGWPEDRCPLCGGLRPDHGHDG